MVVSSISVVLVLNAPFVLPVLPLIAGGALMF